MADGWHLLCLLGCNRGCSPCSSCGLWLPCWGAVVFFTSSLSLQLDCPLSSSLPLLCLSLFRAQVVLQHDSSMSGHCSACTLPESRCREDAMRQPQVFGCGHNNAVRSPPTPSTAPISPTTVTMVTRRADECFFRACNVPSRPPIARSSLPPAARNLWGTGPAWSAEREFLRIPLPEFHDATDGLLVLEPNFPLNDRLHRHVLDDNAETTTVRSLNPFPFEIVVDHSALRFWVSTREEHVLKVVTSQMSNVEFWC